MERVHQVLIDGFHIFVVEEADCHLENLVVLRRENQRVLPTRQINRLNIRAYHLGYNLFLLFAHLVVKGVWQLGDLLVGVVRLTSRNVNAELALVADHNEPFRVRDDLLDVETVARVVA